MNGIAWALVELAGLTAVIGVAAYLFGQWLRRRADRANAVRKAKIAGELFEYRRQSLGDVLNTAMRHPSFVPRRPKSESPWSYGARVYEHLYPSIGVPWGSFLDKGCRVCDETRVHVETIVKTYEWYTQDDAGVMHRAGQLQHDETKSFVHLCDPTRRVVGQVIECETGEGPMVTCIQCFASELP